jgi:hypothetical protein
MNIKNRFIPALVAGVFAVGVNLLVEWLLNHKLVAADYITSVTVGLLTALAIFILFRNRSGKSCS